MKCYACDRLLNTPAPDVPTGRYYCEVCFSSTIEEQFRLAGKEYIPPEFYEEDVELELDQEESHEKWTESDENECEYF